MDKGDLKEKGILMMDIFKRVSFMVMGRRKEKTMSLRESTTVEVRHMGC